MLVMEEEDLQYNAFKILLSTGLAFIKHNANNSKSYLTSIVLTDKELYYKSEFNPKQKDEDAWKKISLFSLKFVVTGPQSDTIQQRKQNKKINENFCLGIVTVDK